MALCSKGQLSVQRITVAKDDLAPSGADFADHDFAFSGLIACHACGCAVVGEIKKERYVYYHCTGYPDKCRGNPASCRRRYVREEVLEAQFTELLGRLKFDDEVLEWVRDALHASHADERREHEEAIKRHQAEYKRLQDRINAMYFDKRDGIIDTAFFEKMSNQWRAEQNRCLREIEQHQNADKSFMDEGVKLLDLARNAQRLFAKQEPGESAAFSISDYRAAPGRTAKWLPPSANPLTCLRKQLQPSAARKLTGRPNCPNCDLAGEPGLEPRLAESEFAVLPLNYSPSPTLLNLSDSKRLDGCFA